MFSRWEGFCENDSLDGPSGGGEVPNWGWLISPEGRPPGGLPAALKECGVRCFIWAFLPVVTRPQKDTRGLVVPTLRAVSERSCRLTLKLNANYSAIAAFQPLPLEWLQKGTKLSVQQLQKQGQFTTKPQNDNFCPSEASFSCLNYYF